MSIPPLVLALLTLFTLASPLTPPTLHCSTQEIIAELQKAVDASAEKVNHCDDKVNH
jgi:hypothetical protein